jgi:hypothetical protein
MPAHRLHPGEGLHGLDRVLEPGFGLQPHRLGQSPIGGLGVPEQPVGAPEMEQEAQGDHPADQQTISGQQRGPQIMRMPPPHGSPLSDPGCLRGVYARRTIVCGHFIPTA